MCGETTARVPQARQTVFFMWLPSASTGSASGTGRSNSNGALPRPRRNGRGTPAITRYTGSSAGRTMGRSVVQEGIGEMREAGLRFGVVGQHRFAGEVARGGDQRPAEVVQQQIVQRRVGQQAADFRQAGGDVFGQRRIGTLGQQHDGAFG